MQGNGVSVLGGAGVRVKVAVRVSVGRLVPAGVPVEVDVLAGTPVSVAVRVPAGELVPAGVLVFVGVCVSVGALV